MKVLLCFAGIRNIGFNAFYDRYQSESFGQLDSFLVPTGLTTLGGHLRERKHEVEYLDLRMVRGWEEAERRIREVNPALVGVTFQTPAREYAIELCRRAKLMGIPTICGGAHPSSIPEDALACPEFDHVVVGEGEVTLPDVCDAYERGEKPERLLHGKVLGDKDVSSGPLPYLSPLYENIVKLKKVGMLVTSRGCPGRCAFCQPVLEKLYGRKLKFQDLDMVFRQIDHYISAYGVNKFFFMDDMFVTRKKRIAEFARRIKQGNYNIQYDINARVDYFDEEMAEHLATSGCNLVSFGFESGSDRKLKMMEKNTTRERNLHIGKVWKKTGKLVLANILVGIPGETEADLEQDLSFIEELEPHLFYYNVMVPYPGTTYWDQLLDTNMIKDFDFARYEMNLNKQSGLIKGVDYDLVHRFEERFENLRRHLDRKRKVSSIIANPREVADQISRMPLRELVGQVKRLLPGARA